MPNHLLTYFYYLFCLREFSHLLFQLPECSCKKRTLHFLVKCPAVPEGMCRTLGDRDSWGTERMVVTSPKAPTSIALHSHLLLRVTKLLESGRGGNWGWQSHGKQLFCVLSATLILCKGMQCWLRDT